MGNTMKQIKAAKITAILLFILYAAVMLYLLFFRRLLLNGHALPAEQDYFRALADRFEPVPFRTVTEFIGRVEKISVSDLAFRNLVGNVVLFIPLGIFLPLIFPKQRRLPVLLITVAGIISIVELTQMFTLLGTCDIDDLILNTAGAAAGFGIYKLICRIRTTPTE